MRQSNIAYYILMCIIVSIPYSYMPRNARSIKGWHEMVVNLCLHLAELFVERKNDCTSHIEALWGNINNIKKYAQTK